MARPGTTHPPEADDPLARIEARLDRLEGAVGRLTDLLDHAMPWVAMAADVADEEARKVAATGADLDARAAATLHLVGSATRPAKARAMARLIDRVEEVEAQVSAMPGTVAMVLDTVDAELGRWRDEGTDVDTVFATGLDLLRRLGDPATARLLDTALSRADLLADAIDLAATAPDVTAMALDVFDDVLAEAGREGVDLGLLAPRLYDATKAGVAFLTSDGFHAFMEAMAEPQAFGHLVPLIRSIRVATSEPPTPVGLFTLLGKLRDPEVQYALGLFLRFTTAIGRTHEAHHDGDRPSLESR